MRLVPGAPNGNESLVYYLNTLRARWALTCAGRNEDFVPWQPRK